MTSSNITNIGTWGRVRLRYLVFSRLQQVCRITQLLQRCRKQTRNRNTFCVVNYCAVKNKLQSPVGQLPIQRKNLPPAITKDVITEEGAKDVRDGKKDTKKEQYEPRDPAPPPGGRRRQ